MITVPGSIPKMIFGLFCNAGLFLPLFKKLLAEQKYQNNHQLPAGTRPLRGALLQPVSANCPAARSSATMGRNKKQLVTSFFLAGIIAYVVELRIGSPQMATAGEAIRANFI